MFDGETFDPTQDFDRLKTQFDKVKHLMTTPHGRWWTIPELVQLVGGSEASISARIRDLRKKKFGAFDVERHRRSGGLWEYRVN
jgi:hypothetical protein